MRPPCRLRWALASVPAVKFSVGESTNDFRKLERCLHIGTTDQVNREHVLFGEEPFGDVPIKVAIQASWRESVPPVADSLQEVLRVDVEAGRDLQAGRDRSGRDQDLAALGTDEELDAREPLQPLERAGAGPRSRTL